MKKLFTLLTMLIVAISTSWAADFTVTLDQFRTKPISGPVKIDCSSLGQSGGKLQLSNGNADFTISSTNANYKIKQIVFTATKSIIKYNNEALSENTYTPASPVSSATFNLTASGGTANITGIEVTLTTSTSETLEELFATALADGVYTTGSEELTVSTVGGQFNDNYINLSKSNNERSLTITAKEGTVLKSIAFYYYDAIFSRTITTSNGSYDADTYTWSPTGDVNNVKFTFNTGNSEGAKIRKIYVSYIATSSSKTATTTTITSASKESLDLAINHGTAAGSLAATVVDDQSNPVASPAVAWESSNPSVATINASTGAVTLVATGTTTLKATYAGNDDYEASNDTYQITVTDTRTNLTGAWSANPTFDKGATPTIPTFEVTGGTKGTDYTVAYTEVSDANNILTVGDNGITDINTNNVGTATVKATVTVVNTTDYKATTTEYTCTVKVNNVLEAVTNQIWDFTDAEVFTDAADGNYTYNAETYVNNVMIGNGAQLMKKTGDAANQIQRLKLNQQGTTSGYYVKIKVAAHSKVTVSAVGGSSRKIYFAENAVGGTKLAEYSCTESSPTDKVLEDSGDGEKVICIYNSASGNITLYSITVEPAPQNITVGDTGFATIGLPFATTVPEGVTAYAVESVSDSKVKMSSAIAAGTTIPANKGFVIVAAKGNYSFAPVASSSYEGTDILEAVGATPKAATPEAPIYVLTVTGAKKVGFKKATTGELGAYKAYLPGTVSNLTSLSASFDEETAINGIAESEANAEAPVKVIKNGQLFIGNYNVAGQQVK